MSVMRWLAGVAIIATTAAIPPALAQSGTQELRLTIGKSVVIDYPSDIGRISTSNPEIVDAVPITAREVLINAKAYGQATIVVWAKTGERSFFAITVESSLEGIQKLLKDTFPNENIELRVTRDTASLTGRVTSQAVSDRAAVLVAAAARTVVNNLQIIPTGVEKQVVLKVKFAELNRSRADQLGINLFSTGAANTPGVITTGQFSPPSVTQVQGAIGQGLQGYSTNFNIQDALNIFAFRPDLNLGATIRALQTQNVLQILAEPNLVTTSGKEASFLAGGEFPIPVLQGGGNAGAVTIQFREFGVRLLFLPVVTPHGTIKMHIRSELSAIDLARAVVFQGFTIPALSTRRAETDVELGEGQSFVVAGLLNDEAREQFSKVPGLGNIPILGKLFQSRSTTRSKSELIVMVSPEVVNPLNPGDLKPMSKMFTHGIPAFFDGVIRDQSAYESSIDPATVHGSVTDSMKVKQVPSGSAAPAARPSSSTDPGTRRRYLWGGRKTSHAKSEPKAEAPGK